jgi:hypothetical protein
VALADPGWRGPATLDAVTRLVSALVRAGGLRRGREVERTMDVYLASPKTQTPGQMPCIPDAYWSAQAAPLAADGTEQVRLRGTVLVRVLGRRQTECAPALSANEPSDPGCGRTAPGGDAFFGKAA